MVIPKKKKRKIWIWPKIVKEHMKGIQSCTDLHRKGSSGYLLKTESIVVK